MNFPKDIIRHFPRHESLMYVYVDPWVHIIKEYKAEEFGQASKKEMMLIFQNEFWVITKKGTYNMVTDKKKG